MIDEAEHGLCRCRLDEERTKVFGFQNGVIAERISL